MTLFIQTKLVLSGVFVCFARRDHSLALIFSNEINELFAIVSFVGYYVSVFVTFKQFTSLCYVTVIAWS